MMSRRFFWFNFEKSFLEKILYCPKTPKRFRPQWELTEKDSLIPYLDDICGKPDTAFVKRYRCEIEEDFLNGSAHLVNICRSLQKHHYRGIKTGTAEEMLSALKKLNMTPTLCKLYIQELLNQGRFPDSSDEDTFFAVPKVVDLTAVSAGEIALHDFQKDAVGALQRHFIQTDKRAGFLVMPTGSGKTRTATSFLLETMVAKGYQILWLAHRSMLIDQAADAFYNFSGVLKKADPEKETLKILCISGDHANIRLADSSQDILIASIQSIYRNTDYLPAVLGDKVIMVIDEAHHTAAPSYKNIVNTVYKYRPEAKLLGLTATPIRLSEKGTAYLNRMYDDHIIYQVSLSKLLKEKILADPEFESVHTGFDIEAHIKMDEMKYIRKWGELKSETVDYLAGVCERNDLIVDTYLKNREHYGKTLLFAMNIHHSISLCDSLQAKGIRCDYIYSRNADNALKIQRFRDNELDVLININILTEGSDIPDIQTVFLTRPTTSDVLLMQMVGRGLRGKAFGGTENVNIVDFCDKWISFTRWLNPAFVFGEEAETPEIPEAPAAKTVKTQLYPWEMFRDIINGITYQYKGSAKYSNTLPIGWYDVTDADGSDTSVLVFSEQAEGFNLMAKDKNLLKIKADGIELQNKYFNNFGFLPSPRDLELLVRQAKTEQSMPAFYSFEQRNEVDASAVALKIKEESPPLDRIYEIILQTYEKNAELTDSIYGSADVFRKRVFDFLANENGDTSVMSAVEEKSLIFLDYDPAPFYDLEELQRLVIRERFGGDFPDPPHISWTNRPVKSYFGQYNADYNRIIINCLLNSKDIPTEALKFVIYHEMLHRENLTHNNDFRAKEHEYPDFAGCEHFLYEKFPKFEFGKAI